MKKIVGFRENDPEQAAHFELYVVVNAPFCLRELN